MEYSVRVTSEVELENEEEIRQLVTQCAKQALTQEKVGFDAFVDVTIVDDDTIQAMNRQYRSKDIVTDVLSFPMYTFYNGEPQEDLENDTVIYTDIMLGDVILNYKRAQQQAQEFGHSTARECGFLTVHSVLHLLGFDHERDEADRLLMRQQEEIILSAVGLTRP
jgi:probable rRNA maturation factor